MKVKTDAETFVNKTAAPAAQAPVAPAPLTKEQAEAEMMKIEIEIQRQVALKAAYATMMAQTEQEIQGLLFARMRMQAEARGVNFEEVAAAKAQIDESTIPGTK
jgi:hypothetical protein